MKQPPEAERGDRAPRWPLWSLLWRTLVIGPILMPFGVLFAGGVAGSIVAPPFYVWALFMEGRSFAGPCLLLGWLVWLRFGLRLWRWCWRGIEYSSL